MAETTSPEPDPFRARGFTVLDRLYMKNGTFFVVTSDSSRFPPREHIISRPVDVGVGNDIAPTDKELQFISPTQAREVLGDHAIPIDGVSFILTDNGQFINHYYHLWGEMILGAWRVYSSLASSVKTVATLPFPSRLILPHISPTEWRDPVNVNGPLLRAAFPSSSVLASDVWNDLLYLGEPVVFQRALVINREAAHGDPLFLVWFKMIAGTWNVTVPPGFWEPLRRTAVENALGYLPDALGSGDGGKLPVVTYISRQSTGRRLREEDHEGLVRSLRELDEEGLCEVHVVRMERMSLKAQIELVARTTVLVGVHGNGLTHQLWMPRTSRSTVVEIFAPGSYNFDYEILSRNMGHRHYAVWNDTLLTYPPGSYHERVVFGDDFHSSSIPVDGQAVAKVVRERCNY
ncbi:hypothetical protein F5887DRAFT_884888 [Amanita rubescens]|nr:hypothetical protein F5887DRAFT_884888 [Amanita rubescens]